MRTNPTPTLTRVCVTHVSNLATLCAEVRGLSLREHAMAAVKTLEAVPLDSRTGLYCDFCASFAVTSVRCAIVDAHTLELQRYATGSLCLQCGAEDG